MWIDLTGNAVSALAIKLAGAKTLAARATRGGRSLIDFPLPHAVQENEYANRERVAEHLGVRILFFSCEAYAAIHFRIWLER